MAIAGACAKIGDRAIAGKVLEEALAVAQEISRKDYRSLALISIAEAWGKIISDNFLSINSLFKI